MKMGGAHMTTLFMTEEEAEKIIEDNIDRILSKITCASNNSNQSCASDSPTANDPTCGCCVNEGAGPCFE
jgi:hypothetical protein